MNSYYLNAELEAIHCCTDAPLYNFVQPTAVLQRLIQCDSKLVNHSSKAAMPLYEGN